MLLSGLSSTSSSTDTTSQSGQSASKLNDDLNKFLNLLVTQLQHQDPLEPMDATQFTSQLVQFASVEQQIYANGHLEDLITLQQTTQVASMVDYLGTTVEASGSTLNMEDGVAKFSYTLGANSRSTTITIKDESGKVVATLTGETEVGYHAAEWDGKDTSGNQLADGIYTVTVSALDSEGATVGVAQTVMGRVTGAGAENGEVVLYMGDVAVPMAAILSVNETPQQSSTE